MPYSCFDVDDIDYACLLLRCAFSTTPLLIDSHYFVIFALTLITLPYAYLRHAAVIRGTAEKDMAMLCRDAI